ncbi:LPXTG cell wall anchor domain-containing protein, partial [Paenibacillus sp. DMB20]
DSFTVTVNDGRGGEVTITVTVDVKGSGKGTAGSGKPPANTENPTPPAKNGDGTPVIKTPEQQNLNQLPDTSANFYNLGLAGFIALFAGWFLMRRKSKA